MGGNSSWGYILTSGSLILHYETQLKDKLARGWGGATMNFDGGDICAISASRGESSFLSDFDHRCRLLHLDKVCVQEVY